MFEKLVWHEEKRLLKDLMPWEGNPRQANEKQRADLEQSMSRFGYVETIAIDLDNTIIGGHFRYSILIQDGLDQEVDVRVPNRKLTPEEFKELNFRMNQNRADWDWDILIQEDRPFLEMVGFDLKEIELRAQVDLPEKEKEGEQKAGKEITCPECGVVFNA